MQQLRQSGRLQLIAPFRNFGVFLETAAGLRVGGFFVASHGCRIGWWRECQAISAGLVNLTKAPSPSADATHMPPCIMSIIFFPYHQAFNPSRDAAAGSVIAEKTGKYGLLVFACNALPWSVTLKSQAGPSERAQMRMRGTCRRLAFDGVADQILKK
jgi:hypothetical protein